MNEFEWRRQLRDLRQPLTPTPDLWLSIDAALTRADHGPVACDETPPARQHASTPRWWIAVAAASVLLFGSVTWRTLQVPAPARATVVRGMPSPWKPADPRLAGAAIELDAAQMELKLALQQAPNSAALERLLERTQLQQIQLRQRTGQAG